MLITKLKQIGSCSSGLIFCVILNAQTSGTTTVPAAGQAAADANATQFPHDSKAPPSDVAPPQTETPLLWDGYETHFAIEFGGRALSNSGNADVYATFVNLQPGVRLMDESLEMHSTNHNGSLFDDLSESAFGLGGDPNEVVRLRASKHHWYDFTGSWRRDVNFWDYNLLGNPLNPPSSPQVNVSPALLDLSRKLLDLNLTLLPDSKLYFVLGYSRYDNGGPSLTTVHEGTEAELFQQWHDVSDSYHFGVFWKPVERTRLSYDQFYTHDRSDTYDYLNSFPYSLANGTPVNLGTTYNSSSPCAAPFAGSFANPTCNLYTGYSDNAPYYTDIPTEQLGFETNYWRRLQITGRASYTGAQTHLPNSAEIFSGLVTRTGEAQGVQTGSGSVQEITTSADFGVSYDITERFWIDDQFRWYDYRIPSGASFLQTYLFSSSALIPPNTFPSAACPAPYTGPGCPQHTTGSSADSTITDYSMFQAQNQKRNTFELHYTFAKNVTGYIGYRFEREDYVIDGTTAALASYFPTRPNRGGCTAAPVNGVCQDTTNAVSAAGVEINTQAGLIGIAAQPVPNLRLNGDMEFDYADNVFTNIMPRHEQLYRAKAIYTPRKWLNLDANVRIQEMRNLSDGLGNLQHNRSVSFGAVFPISSRVGVSAHYSYDNFLSNVNICFSETPVPAFATTSPVCPVPYLTALSYYHDVDNFGSANLMVKPIERVTIAAGYTITSTSGNNLLLNPYAPLGPAAITYHLPTAALAIGLSKRLTLKGGWNFYDYDEKSAPLAVLPRNFRANLISISLRYVM
jgi:hypothetical protein